MFVVMASVEARSVAPRPLSSGRSWQHRPIIAIPFLILIALALIFRCGFGPAVLHDSLSIYWVWADQFTAELARGHAYPRWLPDSYAGLGAPVFYYYPPLAFYLTGAFGLLGFSTYASLIAAFGSSFAASGIGCWYWLRQRSAQPLLGAVLFMAAPYHLFDYVDRGALAESVAIALIPVMAIGLRRIAEDRSGLVLAAVSYAALIATHLPLALLTSVFLIAPYAIWHRRRMARFTVAIALGIGSAAIYLLPALALEPYHDGAQLYRAPAFRTAFWSIFSGNWSDPTYAMIFLIMAALVASAAIIVVRQRDRWAAFAIAVMAIVAGFVPFFWSLPMLGQVQFPYRALPIAEFALVTAWARLPLDRRFALHIGALPLLVSAIILPGFYTSARDLDRLKHLHPDTYEYLPRGVLAPNETKASLREVLASRVPAPRVEGKVVEERFYFPAWSCGTAESRTQLLVHDPSCRPQLIMTPSEKVGAALSVLSILILMLLAWTRSASTAITRSLFVGRGRQLPSTKLNLIK